MRNSVVVVISVIVILCLCVGKREALDNGLGRTPQMGWNSWNHFQCNINEKVIMNTAKAIASGPLKAAGYVYVNVDDCWAKSRMANGTVVADAQAFPSGIKALADYVHSLGLKFGIYSDAGTATCAGRPGSLGYEKIDAATYASWGVDYLKYDNCNSGSKKPEERYPIMRDALNATGRHIFFSMCEWGVDHPAEWAREVGNSWRTTNDIIDSWISMMSNVDYTALIASAAGPGGWNDPDMLEVGNGGMSFVEYQTHFSLWAITKSPLIIGNDVTNMNSEVLGILTNSEVIAINQDPLGVQARRITFPLASAASSHVIISECKGTPNQRWTIDNSDKTIRSVLTGSCLDLPDCSTQNGVQLGVWACHVGDPNQPCNNQNQQWTLNSDGTVRNQFNGRCMDVWYNAGPPVIAWDCGKTPTNNEKWKYNSTTQELTNLYVNDAYYGGCLTVQTFSDQEVWAGPLAGGAVAVALVNRGDGTAEVTAPWKDIGLASGVSATVRDLWAHKDLGSYTNSFAASVVAHGTVLVKITPNK